MSKVQNVMNQVILDKSNKALDNGIDFKKYFLLFFRHWYYFLISLLLSAAVAYLYLRYVIPIYRVVSTILIDDNQSNGGLGTENLMEGFGLRAGRRNLDNQIQILSSWSLINLTLQEVDLSVDYYAKGKISGTNLYPNHPFKVVKDSLGTIPHGVEFEVTLIEEGKFHIISNDDLVAINTIAKFGETIESGRNRFHIEKSLEFWDPSKQNKTYYFKSRGRESLVNYYRNRLSINQPNVESTIIELNMEGPVWRKDVDFMNKLIEVFMATNLSKKNLEANRTINFINNQIQDISDSLVIAEDRLQDFRSQHKVMNISEQGSQVLEQAVRLEDEKARLMIEADYYKYLTDYLTGDQVTDQVIAPATMGITDPTMVNLVSQLAELQSEYYSLGAGGKNPMQMNLSIRIENTKNALLETLKGIVRSNNYAIEENKTRLRQLNRRAESLPVTERQLLGIEREFKLNDALYTYLLQKQAEAQIQKASNTSDSEVIDPPRGLGGPVWPKVKLIYFLAIFFGFVVPALVLIIIDSVRFKIVSEEDVKIITDLPITGHIVKNKKKIQNIVLQDKNSVVSESFRSLRTRLRFFIKGENAPVILITSSVPGEGKSFTSLNLAGAFSLEGKKTVLVGFDLRRPKLFEDLNLNNEKGVTTYLIGKDKIEDFIKNTEYPNLDFLPAGPVPPNPSELISSERAIQLISELKRIYEYIIIDSAPIGSVSDTYNLLPVVNTCLLMVRIKYSPKQNLENTLSEIKSTGIHNIGIVLNEISPRKGYYGYQNKST